MDARAPGRPIADRRGGSERRTADRRNADRRNPERSDPNRPDAGRRRQDRRLGSGSRRQDPRHQVPFGPCGVSGYLRTDDGTLWQASLWDISKRGCCLVVVGESTLDQGSLLLLTLHENVHLTSEELSVELCWQQNCQGYTTFLGVKLADDGELPEGSFLTFYLERHWAESEPIL